MPLKHTAFDQPEDSTAKPSLDSDSSKKLLGLSIVVFDMEFVKRKSQDPYAMISLFPEIC
ncbi:hypothetical protein MADA3029_1230179 [Vibrio nigripulchritudo MADA3029]|nr:hypothetical protein VIBNIMADA3020_580178 [Vibrio nigripulchritudo MADA3020]CCN52089.1 hypothetical protein VIBNIMADA3021_1210019 [Vibrio nigripulchritudo MADA3021]CCN58181.1 hypothetical protein MADA3029_1230179 [Vibrio nigripulchritudo MADA3029]